MSILEEKRKHGFIFFIDLFEKENVCHGYDGAAPGEFGAGDITVTPTCSFLSLMDMEMDRYILNDEDNGSFQDNCFHLAILVTK